VARLPDDMPTENVTSCPHAKSIRGSVKMEKTEGTGLFCQMCRFDPQAWGGA